MQSVSCTRTQVHRTPLKIAIEEEKEACIRGFIAGGMDPNYEMKVGASVERCTRERGVPNSFLSSVVIDI